MKVLVIYATAGAGHRKAAEALYSGLKSRPDIDAFLVDSLDYTNPFYKQLYSQTYTFLISKTPWLWGFLFGLLDIKWVLPLVRLVRRIQNAVNARRLSQHLIREKFDYIFSTHFFPTEVAAYLRKKGKINTTVVCSVTDFDVHTIWLADGVDYYTVASEWTKDKLQTLGISEGKIIVSGIPTDKKFSDIKDIDALRQKLDLKKDVFTVLVATGSFGIGPIEEIIRQLPDFQVMVVCGHNKALYKRLSRTEKELVKIFGLVDNMYELMAAADIMITKPGGLSISEALVSGLPLVFFNAIPGQESDNIKVLKEYGIGISGCRIEEMAKILDRFKSSSEEFQAAQERTKILAKPEAVNDIVALIK